MPSYKPEGGNVERQRIAQERAKAIHEGRLPQWEAQQKARVEARPQPLPEKRDFMKGDPQRLKEKLEQQAKLYPRKSPETSQEQKQEEAA